MPDKTPVTKKEKAAAVETVLHEFKQGELHSGSKEGPKVKSRDQAVAIAMNESNQSKPKPSRNSGSHGYGHPAPQRHGHLRMSGHGGGHRIGKK